MKDLFACYYGHTKNFRLHANTLKCGDNEQCSKSKVQRKNTEIRSRANMDL